MLRKGGFTHWEIDSSSNPMTAILRDRQVVGLGGTHSTKGAHSTGDKTAVGKGETVSRSLTSLGCMRPTDQPAVVGNANRGQCVSVATQPIPESVGE